MAAGMRIRTAALAAAILYASPATADYFVSGSGSLGGDGSAGNPWRELSQAVAHGLAAGDVVHVANGTYNPFAIDDVIGASGNPIRFQVNAGATATINGGMNDGGNRDGIRIQRSSHLVIDGFTLVGTADPSTSRAGISSVAPLGAELGNGQVSGNYSDIVISNNKISNYGRWGVFTGFTNNVQVLSNNISGSVAEHGVYLSNASTGQIVRGNVVSNNNASGIQLNGDFSLGGGGIISNSLVEKNLLIGNGVGGGGALNNEGVQNSVFRNNVLYNNHASGIVLWIGANGAPNANSSNNNLVVNNTVFQASDGRGALNINKGFDNTVFNNILYNSGNPTFKDAVDFSTADDTRTVLDYNAYSPNFEFNGTDVDFATWMTLTGGATGDAHSRIITSADLAAIFAAAASGDLHLLPGAGDLALDAGIDSFNSFLAPLLDYDGNIRPQGAGFDIGAFEFTPVPEPAAVLAAGLGALALITRLRRRA